MSQLKSQTLNLKFQISNLKHRMILPEDSGIGLSIGEYLQHHGALALLGEQRHHPYLQFRHVACLQITDVVLGTDALS